MKDQFDIIHELLAAQKYDQVLEELYDSKLNCIRHEYKSDTNHAWYLVGDIFFKRGEFGRSINAFKNAIAAWGEDVEAMMALANSYSEMEKFSLAETYLLRALELQPNNAALIYNLANALFDQKKYSKALQYYSKIVEDSDPEIFNRAQSNIKLTKKKM